MSQHCSLFKYQRNFGRPAVQTHKTNCQHTARLAYPNTSQTIKAKHETFGMGGALTYSTALLILQALATLFFVSSTFKRRGGNHTVAAHATRVRISSSLLPKFEERCLDQPFAPLPCRRCLVVRLSGAHRLCARSPQGST